MQRVWPFLAGIVLGFAGGVGGGWLVAGRVEREPATVAGPVADHTDCRAAEALLRTEIETLRARVEGTAGSGASAAPEPTPAEPTPAIPEDATYREALAKVRADLAALSEEEPGSPRVMELLGAWRGQLDVDNDRLSRLAGRALVRLAGLGKLRPADVDRLATDFDSLPGSRARPALAGAVARAWAREPRLTAWFERLPTTGEPDVREWAVWALDESPSDALRDYVLRLSREESNSDVLNSIWNEDIILVTMTKDFAPRLVAVIETRVGTGDLPPPVRGRACFAIGLAGMHAPAEARAALARLVAAELDDGVRAFGEDVLGAIDREESNVQALEGLWDRHRGSFGQ